MVIKVLWSVLPVTDVMVGGLVVTSWGGVPVIETWDGALNDTAVVGIVSDDNTWLDPGIFADPDRASVGWLDCLLGLLPVIDDPDVAKVGAISVIRLELAPVSLKFIVDDEEAIEGNVVDVPEYIPTAVEAVLLGKEVAPPGKDVAPPNKEVVPLGEEFVLLSVSIIGQGTETRFFSLLSSLFCFDGVMWYE